MLSSRDCVPMVQYLTSRGRPVDGGIWSTVTVLCSSTTIARRRGATRWLLHQVHLQHQ